MALLSEAERDAIAQPQADEPRSKGEGRGLLGQRETPQDEAQAKRKTSHGCRNCCARIEAWPRISPTYSRACRRSADRALPLANRASEKARPILLPCRHRTVACTSRFLSGMWSSTSFGTLIGSKITIRAPS